MARLAPKTFLGETQRSWASEDLYLEVSYYKEGSSFPRHAHANPYFSFVLEGACQEQSCLGSSEYSTKSGVFHAAGSEHSNRWLQSGQCMSLELLPGFWRRFEQEAVALNSCFLGRQISDLAPKLGQELIRLDDASGLVIEGNALLLVASLLRQPQVEVKAPRWLQTAKEIFNEEFVDPPSLAEVAARVGVHPSHLARTFQKHFGQSVGEFVRRVRVERAQSYLTSTDLRLGEISLSLGFSDQSHFNRCFKTQIGMTPREYRRLRRPNITPVPRS